MKNVILVKFLHDYTRIMACALLFNGEIKKKKCTLEKEKITFILRKNKINKLLEVQRDILCSHLISDKGDFLLTCNHETSASTGCLNHAFKQPWKGWAHPETRLRWTSNPDPLNESSGNTEAAGMLALQGQEWRDKHAQLHTPAGAGARTQPRYVSWPPTLSGRSQSIRPN